MKSTITSFKAKFKATNFLGFILSPIKIISALLSKSLLLSALGVNEYSDTLFLSFNIASTIGLTVIALSNPAFYSLVAGYKNYISMKMVVKEQSGLLLLACFPVTGISSIIAYFYAKNLDNDLSYLLLISTIMFCLSGMMAGVIQCNMYLIRLRGSNQRADLINGFSPIILSILPVLLMTNFGINGFIFGSFVASASVAIFLFFTENSFPKFPSRFHLKRVQSISSNMIGVALVSKLFPLVESFSLVSAGPGLFTTYSFTKSIYSGLLSILSLGFLQRLIAKIQLNISAARYFECFNLILMNSLNMLKVSVFLFISVLLLNGLIDRFGLLILPSDEFNLALLIPVSISLFPFFIASAYSQFIMPALYALNDFKFIAFISVASALVFMVLMIFFSKIFGIMGACVTISMYFTINSLIYFRRLTLLLKAKPLAIL